MGANAIDRNLDHLLDRLRQVRRHGNTLEEEERGLPIVEVARRLLGDLLGVPPRLALAFQAPTEPLALGLVRFVGS